MEKNNNLIYKLHKLLAIKKDLITLILRPDTRSLEYQAGQYLEILYPDGSFQPFSIANAPDQTGQIELHIRLLEKDYVTQSMLDNLREKGALILRGPYGKAYYRAQPKNPVVLLAGGTGFAYIKALMEKAIQVNDARYFHFYWGVKTSADFYMPNLPLLWESKLKNFHYTPVISQVQQDLVWSGATGYIHNIAIADYPDFSNLQVYASGPMAMIQTAFIVFQQHGLKRENMHSDMLIDEVRN